MLEAYKMVNANAECHIFPMGGHGLSIANNSTGQDIPYITRWVEMTNEWIKNKIK